MLNKILLQRLRPRHFQRSSCHLSMIQWFILMFWVIYGTSWTSSKYLFTFHWAHSCKVQYNLCADGPQKIWLGLAVCKMLCPPPEILVAWIHAVIQMYGPLKDAITSAPLFNDESWDKAKDVVENIQMGFYSDPPGINLYMIQLQDKHRLFVYHCVCCTNNVEGSVH